MVIGILVILFCLMAFKATHSFAGMIASLPFHDLDLINTLLLVALNAILCLYRYRRCCRKREKTHNYNNCKNDSKTHDNEQIMFRFYRSPPIPLNIIISAKYSASKDSLKGPVEPWTYRYGLGWGRPEKVEPSQKCLRITRLFLTTRQTSG